MTHPMFEERLFDDPALEHQRRLGHCALLLANAHRWATQYQTTHGDYLELSSGYLRRFNHAREAWGLEWREVSAACAPADVQWAVTKQLSGDSGGR